MNEEAEKSLLEKIDRLEALITHPVKRQSSFEKVANKLREPSTQQGLVVLVPLVSGFLFNADKDAMAQIVIGVLTMVAGHNVIRKENVK